MVSLAVLGLIAGLTVPSIVTSVDRSKNRSLLKEAFQTVSAITQAGVLNGDFAGITDWNTTTSTNPQGIVAYISSKLSYSKQCLTTDITSEGCKRGFPGQPANSAFNTHNTRWILPNGTKLQAFNTSSWASTIMMWTVTSKAFANDMVQTGTNPDTILLTCNTSDAIMVLSTGGTLKSGMCGAYDNSTWLTTFNTVMGYS